MDASTCPTCGADLETLDEADFEQKLLWAVNHPLPDTAIHAVETLGKLRSTRAVGPLLARYRAGTDPYLAAAIARTLGQIGGEEAEEALAVLGQDPSVIVKQAAREAGRRQRP